MNPAVTDVQFPQAVVQPLGKTARPAEYKIKLIVVLHFKDVLEQRGVDPSGQVKVLALVSIGLRLTEQTQHPHRITGVIQQTIQFGAKRLIRQRARTLEKPCRPNVPGAQALIHHLPHHRQQGRNAYTGGQQHQWPTFMGCHGEVPLRRAGFQQITDTNPLMQMRRHPPFSLHADAEKVIGRRARQAVGADMHLSANVEPQR